MPLVTAKSGDNVVGYTATGITGASQIVGIAQPKDLFDITTRAAITAADISGATFDPSSVTPIAVPLGYSLWVGAYCDTANATLSLLPALWCQRPSGVFQFMGIGSQSTFTASSFWKTGSNYWASITTGPLVIDLVAAGQVALIVTSVSAGSWTLISKPF